MNPEEDNSYAVRIASFNTHRSPTVQSSFPYARSTKQVPKHRLKPNQLTPAVANSKEATPTKNFSVCGGWRRAPLTLRCYPCPLVHAKRQPSFSLERSSWSRRMSVMFPNPCLDHLDVIFQDAPCRRPERLPTSDRTARRVPPSEAWTSFFSSMLAWNGQSS